MPTAYWSVDSIIHAVKDNPFEGSDEQALDVLDQALMPQ